MITKDNIKSYFKIRHGIDANAYTINTLESYLNTANRTTQHQRDLVQRLEYFKKNYGLFKRSNKVSGEDVKAFKSALKISQADISNIQKFRKSKSFKSNNYPSYANQSNESLVKELYNPDDGFYSNNTQGKKLRDDYKNFLIKEDMPKEEEGYISAFKDASPSVSDISDHVLLKVASTKEEKFIQKNYNNFRNEILNQKSELERTKLKILENEASIRNLPVGTLSLGGAAGVMLGGSEAGRGNLSNAATMVAGTSGSPIAVFGTSAVTSTLMADNSKQAIKRSLISSALSALGGSLGKSVVDMNIGSNSIINKGMRFMISGNNGIKGLMSTAKSMAASGAGVGSLTVGLKTPLVTQQQPESELPSFDVSGVMKDIKEEVDTTVDESFAKIINYPKFFGTMPINYEYNEREIPLGDIKKFYKYPNDIKNSIKESRGRIFKTSITAF